MKPRPKNCPHGHPYSKENTYISKIGRHMCRKCSNERAKIWRSKNKDKIRKYFKKYGKEYTKSGKAIISVNKWKARNKEKNSIYLKVFYEIKMGRMIKGECEVCGNPKVDGHHKDYSKPLEVTWLCRKHHKEEHNRILKELTDGK